MAPLTFTRDQLIGITELQRNASAISAKAKNQDILILKNNAPHVVMIDCDRYEELLERAEQAEIYAMLLERKKEPVWIPAKDVFAS